MRPKKTSKHLAWAWLFALVVAALVFLPWPVLSLMGTVAGIVLGTGLTALALAVVMS